ncbi:MAG: SusC/RagA family TonB-linked outer membrane protein [Ferruginibacter sp.]
MRRFLTLFTVLMLSGVLAFSQGRTVTGTVSDDSGNPVPYATVTETGTKNATTADANGNFSLKMKGSGTITFTAAGYGAGTISPSGNSATISLKRTNAELSTVVVTTALGLKREAKATGYSTATIPTGELTAARPTNIANGLSGKVSGLQINTVNNGVTADTRIVLRGERSITGNNQALIIVDNLAVSADFINSLNPDDVENITILKGANAAALYGSDASNGVIIITRKKGIRAKPQISFTHTTTLEQVSYFPKLNTRFGAASTESDSLNPYTGFYGRIPYENQMYGPEYNGQRVALGYVKQLVRADGSVYDSTNYISYDYKDPVKNFFQTGVTNQDGVSYQAGNANGSYFFSAQVNNTTGTIPMDKATRYTVTLGGSTVYNKFSSNFTIGYTKFITDIAGVDYSQGRPVYWNVLNTPGEVPLKNFKDLNAPFANENDWYNAYYPNPYWQLNNSRQKSFRDDILGSLELGFKATNWLNFTYRIGATASNFQQKNTKAGVTFSEYEISDPLGAENNASGNPNGVRPKVYDRLNEKFILQSTFLINLQHKFLNNDLDARLVLGNTLSKSRERDLRAGEGVNGGTGELEIPGLYNQSNLINPATATEYVLESGKIGAFGSLQLSYRNFLFVEVTGRNDWVSVLAPKNRSFFYPGVSASFVFTDAIPVMKNISWLNFGKVTASYTKVGNVSNVDPYSLSDKFSQTSGFPYGTTSFSVGNTLANPGLQPEIIKSKEFGLQLGFLKNRIQFGATYYNEDASNQTVPIQISSASGYTNTLKNVGNVNNQGWEFDLKLNPLINLGPVKWNFGGNLAFYQSKVDEIDPQSESIFIGGYTNNTGIYTIKGQPMRVLQIKDWKRDSLGRVIVDPKTGRPSATAGIVNVGQVAPKVILGLNTSFDYKNLTLSVLGEYRGGYVVYNNVGSATAFTGVSEVTTLTGRQRFIYPNSVIKDANGKYQPNTSVVVDNASNGSSFWASTFRTAGTPFITSGDYWKIREISLVYTLNVKNNKIVKKASIGLVARNVFTFLPKDNVYADPEYSLFGASSNVQGISNENLSPPTRVYGATLTVGF